MEQNSLGKLYYKYSFETDEDFQILDLYRKDKHAMYRKIFEQFPHSTIWKKVNDLKVLSSFFLAKLVQHFINS